MNGAFEPSLQREAARLEYTRVKLVVKEFGLQAHLGRVYDAHCCLVGENGLSFAAFDSVFPGFPICLRARPLYRLAEHSTCSQTALFRDFRRSVPFRAYDDLRELTSGQTQGRPLGMLYRWPGLRHGLILHNGDFPTGGFRQVFEDADERLVVEHFARFLRTLAAGDWDTDSFQRPPASHPDRPARSARAPTPWKLAGVLTDRNELRLMALLVETLHHGTPEGRRRCIVRGEDGARWISVTNSKLAEVLRASERSVERALHGLRSRGLLVTRRGPAGVNQFRLDLGGLPGDRSGDDGQDDDYDDYGYDDDDYDDGYDSLGHDACGYDDLENA